LKDLQSSGLDPQLVRRLSAITSQLSTSRTLRVALVGCGKIADQHVQAIRRIPDCTIAGLCDRELLMAEQLGERFEVNACFSDLQELLATTSPDVVHITTPPQSHYVLARECLEAGEHVYLEKPFTVTAEEAESLIQLADRRNVKITAGHNLQFTLEMLEMRRLVGEGFLGGKPVHLESHFSYDLGDRSYVGALLGNRRHWVRQLPGQLLHNIISHGIARLAEFLDDEIIEINAMAGQSPRLQDLGEEEILDELRVVIRDKNGTTALFCFSTQIKGLNQLRIYGPAASITADIITGSLVRNTNRSYKSYLTYFVPPLKNAREHLRNARRNLTNFVRRRLYQDFGMKELVERFYNSIRKESPLPIPYREIILTARIMDEIFAQIYPRRGQKSDDREQREAPVHLPVSPKPGDGGSPITRHILLSRSA
jgi:predicted dehydrogenase